MVWARGPAVTHLCTVPRKTWAGHRALFYAKCAIGIRIGFIGAVSTDAITDITSLICPKTPAAIPAHGKAWTSAVVTDRRIFIAAIIARIQAITVKTLLAQTDHLTTDSAGELGRIINTVGAFGQQFIVKIIARIPAITLITLLAQTHHLTTDSAGELGRIINTVGALGQQFITIIITMMNTIAFELRIQTNINPAPLTLKQMVIVAVVALGRDGV